MARPPCAAMATALRGTTVVLPARASIQHNMYATKQANSPAAIAALQSVKPHDVLPFGRECVFLSVVPFYLFTAIQYTNLRSGLIAATAVAGALLLLGLLMSYLDARHVRAACSAPCMPSQPNAAARSQGMLHVQIHDRRKGRSQTDTHYHRPCCSRACSSWTLPCWLSVLCPWGCPSPTLNKSLTTSTSSPMAHWL